MRFRGTLRLHGAMYGFLAAVRSSSNYVSDERSVYRVIELYQVVIWNLVNITVGGSPPSGRLHHHHRAASSAQE